jgi:hypothetical protein
VEAMARFTARIAADVQHDNEISKVMMTPGGATASGLAAFGEANYDMAFKHLRSAQPNFRAMGGSHAQRDIFERLTIEAGLRAGRMTETKTLLRARTSLRNGREDSFAASRMAQIAEMQTMAASHTAAE